jgi:hypothetical protein
MEKERDRLLIFYKRAQKDIEDENTRYHELREQLINGQEENATEGTDENHKLRLQIDRMKKEMEKVALYSIDIANDPSKAIKRISDPILKLLDVKVEDFQDQLMVN